MKQCRYARKCPWGNIYNRDYCALEDGECEKDKEELAMIDLEADIEIGRSGKIC